MILKYISILFVFECSNVLCADCAPSEDYNEREKGNMCSDPFG